MDQILIDVYKVNENMKIHKCLNIDVSSFLYQLMHMNGDLMFNGDWNITVYDHSCYLQLLL